MTYFPHLACLRGDVQLMTVYIIGNVSIWLAYMGIPYLLRKATKARGIEFPLDRMFLAFIFFCGIGHFIQVTLLWYPNYWFGACWDLFTATVSWRCLFLLWRYLQEYMQLLTWPEEQKRMNAKIAELEERIAAFGGCNA